MYLRDNLCQVHLKYLTKKLYAETKILNTYIRVYAIIDKRKYDINNS